SLVAGIVPTLTSLASVGVAALENYASESLPVDYGPLGTGCRYTDDAESASAEVTPAVVEMADTATAVVSSGSAAAPTTAAPDAEQALLIQPNQDETAADRVFIEPLSLAELSSPLPDHFMLSNGLDGDWSN